MVRYVINRSIVNGARTKEDWMKFRKQQKAIEEDSLVEWSLEEENILDKEEAEELAPEEEATKAAGRKADTRTLSELLITNKEKFIEKIETRLRTRA